MFKVGDMVKVVELAFNGSFNVYNNKYPIGTIGYITRKYQSDSCGTFYDFSTKNTPSQFDMTVYDCHICKV